MVVSQGTVKLWSTEPHQAVYRMGCRGVRTLHRALSSPSSVPGYSLKRLKAGGCAVLVRMPRPAHFAHCLRGFDIALAALVSEGCALLQQRMVKVLPLCARLSQAGWQS